MEAAMGEDDLKSELFDRIGIIHELKAANAELRLTIADLCSIIDRLRSPIPIGVGKIVMGPGRFVDQERETALFIWDVGDEMPVGTDNPHDKPGSLLFHEDERVLCRLSIENADGAEKVFMRDLKSCIAARREAQS
jgi:hypothetical protein